MGSCTNQINQIKFNQMQVFEERGKPEYPGKNLSEQRREPTNSTHIWHRGCSLHYATTAPWLLYLMNRLRPMLFSLSLWADTKFLLTLFYFGAFFKRIFQELQRNSQNNCARVENTVQLEEGCNSSGDTKESSGAKTRSFSGWCCFNCSTSHTSPNLESFNL